MGSAMPDRVGGKLVSMTDKTNSVQSSGVMETMRTVGYALLIALIIRALLFQPFSIPSGSMLSTLLIGDYLFVSKYAYGYSKHSLPFSPPLFSGRILGGEPERGDVAVFKLPTDGRTDYIKRVIGLPGDRIQMRDGQLFINDEGVPRERVEDFVEEDRFGNIRRVARYRETLSNGRSYLTLDQVRGSSGDNTGVFTVPAGHFFMMGDNRDNSQDSRVPGAVGFVPFENLVGRAEFIFYSTDGSARFWEFWQWPSVTRWGRIGQGVN